MRNKTAWTRKILVLIGFAVLPLAVQAQIPDLLNAFDAGGRAMGIGGSTLVTDSNTLSSLENPAGLAYITEPTFQMTARNMPRSLTTVTDSFTDRTTTVDQKLGKYGLTHIGYATPFRGGTLGASYTISGYVDNFTGGNDLDFNALTVQNLFETNRLQTDMFTLSYGRRNGTMNYGFGLVIANQYVHSAQSYDIFDGNTQVGTVDTDESGTAMGVGLVGGVQGQVSGNSNMVWGASVRTPIKLNGDDTVEDYYGTVPGKIAVGIAGRLDRFSQGRDFLIYGLQGNFYFGGDESAVYSRENVFGFGVGLEYSMFRFGGRMPIRLGYASVPSGGDGFSSRDSLTFGIGYRPDGQAFSIDLNFAKPTGGSALDIALGFTYRPN